MQTETTQTISVEEAAVVLGIKRALAYKLARTGQIPALRLGTRKLRVPKAALDRMLEGAKQTAVTE